MEYAGAVNHVTHRGNEHKAIYRDNNEHAGWITSRCS